MDTTQRQSIDLNLRKLAETAGFSDIYTKDYSGYFRDIKGYIYLNGESTIPNYQQHQTRMTNHETIQIQRLQSHNCKTLTLSLVLQNIRNIALTDLITSRSNYPPRPIQHIIT